MTSRPTRACSRPAMARPAAEPQSLGEREDMTRRTVLRNGIFGLAFILGVQVLTYRFFSTRAMVDALVDLSPSTSLCPAVCYSRHLEREFRVRHRSRLEQLLRLKYQAVYAGASDLPDSALILDGDGNWVQLRGVCLLDWTTQDSGPFWFTATFSSWHGPGSRMAVEKFYVWGLFKWVAVKSKPTLWQSYVVAQLLLEADGVRHTHAG